MKTTKSLIVFVNFFWRASSVRNFDEVAFFQA